MRVDTSSRFRYRGELDLSGMRSCAAVIFLTIRNYVSVLYIYMFIIESREFFKAVYKKKTIKL